MKCILLERLHVLPVITKLVRGNAESRISGFCFHIGASETRLTEVKSELRVSLGQEKERKGVCVCVCVCVAFQVITFVVLEDGKDVKQRIM